MPDKLLTVIVPSYNMEEYLPKCLGSLIVPDEAMLQRLDVIVVNDGSKDRTSEIAHDFEKRYPGVFRVIDKANGHYGSCINAALPSSIGLYVKILDADDWFDTDVFVRYLQMLELEKRKTPHPADLILNDFTFVSPSSSVVKHYPFGSKDVISLSQLDFHSGRDVWMHAVAYRTKSLQAMHYKQLEGLVHTDIQWVHLPMTTVSVIRHFSEPLYMYLHLRENNTSNPKEFYHTYHVQMAILKTMIRDYDRFRGTIGEEQQLYLKNHLIYRAMRAYNVYLLERSPLLKRDGLQDLDAFLVDHANWLYEEMDMLTFSQKIPYHYVRAWRKKKCLTSGLVITLCMAKQVQRIGRLMKRWIP